MGMAGTGKERRIIALRGQSVATNSAFNCLLFHATVYNLCFQVYCEEISMVAPHSFRSIMYVTLAAAILPVMVACSSGDSTSQADDVDLRIRPVARFELQGAEPEPAAAAEGEAVTATEGEAAAAPAALKDGATIYASLCFTCHDIGLAGAPKKGNKADWAPRIAAGKDALYATALNGKGAMPAKGGNPSLSDDEIKGAVDYLVGLAQ
jgi:cytochrome c5